MLTVAVLDPQPLEQKAPLPHPRHCDIETMEAFDLLPFLSRVPTVFYETSNACDAFHIFPVFGLHLPNGPLLRCRSSIGRLLQVPRYISSRAVIYRYSMSASISAPAAVPIHRG